MVFEPITKQKVALYYLTQHNGVKFIGYGGSAGCFGGRVRILTNNGYVCISSLNVGDKIYSFNESLRVLELKVITETFKYDLA